MLKNWRTPIVFSEHAGSFWIIFRLLRLKNVQNLPNVTMCIPCVIIISNHIIPSKIFRDLPRSSKIFQGTFSHVPAAFSPLGSTYVGDSREANRCDQRDAWLGPRDLAAPSFDLPVADPQRPGRMRSRMMGIRMMILTSEY